MRVDRGLARVARLALFVAASVAFGPCAFAQSPSCVSLQNQWAALDRKDAERTGGLTNAARRQNAELQRSFAYARQIGCDNRRFLIFGSDPPPQCGPLMARISRMQADLANLQAQMGRPGGAAQADEQRYQLQLAMRQYCGGDRPQGGPLGAPGNLDTNLDTPQQIDIPGGIEPGQEGGSGTPVCVRLCDGYFFPLASLGSRGRADTAGMCQAQCPGAETEAFSMGAGDDIEHAVGEGGKSYMELENALRYQKATVPDCSCRKADQSWGQALKPAEDMLGGSDTVIDAEKAARMSRPPSPADTKKPAGTRAGPAPASGASPSISTSPAPAIAASGNHGATAGQSSPSPGEPPRKVRIILPPPTQQAPQAQPTQPAQSAQP
ncbi:MAG: DUF2865 domain-containing protein [Beijerinckiaceae bacterium]